MKIEIKPPLTYLLKEKFEHQNFLEILFEMWHEIFRRDPTAKIAEISYETDKIDNRISDYLKIQDQMTLNGIVAKNISLNESILYDYETKFARLRNLAYAIIFIGTIVFIFTHGFLKWCSFFDVLGGIYLYIKCFCYQKESLYVRSYCNCFKRVSEYYFAYQYKKK